MLILFDLVGLSFLFSLMLTPLVRRAGARLGLLDLPDNNRKSHSEPIPRVGGVAVAISYMLSLAFILIAPYRNLNLNIPEALGGALALVPAAAIIFGTGLLDDLVGLRPWQKLIGQVTAALLAYYGGFGISVLRGEPLPEYISMAATVLWLVACTNALNLIDGMDGLAAGVGFFAAATCLIAALTHQNLQLALVTAPLVGSLLGFLRYNFNPASVFLGDSGSLLVGFLLGCYGALWSHKSATLLGMTAPLMVLAIPLLDVLVSIVRRFLRNKPIFTADRGHIHHRLLDRGLTPRRAVLILYGICGLGAAFSLLQDVAQDSFGGLIIVLFCAAAWVGVQHLGYTEFGLAGQFFLQGGLRRVIDVQVRLQQFEKALIQAVDLRSSWDVLANACRDFGFSGARMKIGTEILQADFATADSIHVWQLRIPLSQNDYVNLYNDFDSRMHPLTISGFADIVYRNLSTDRFEASSSCTGHVNPIAGQPDPGSFHHSGSRAKAAHFGM